MALPLLALQLESPAAFSSCSCWVASSTSASTAARTKVCDVLACFAPNVNNDFKTRVSFTF